MKILKYSIRTADHVEDATTIAHALAKVGFSVTLAEAERMWRAYSQDVWATGWMRLPETEQEIIIALVEEI